MIVGYDGNFIAFIYCKADVFEKHFTFYRFRQLFNIEDLVTNFTLLFEDDTGVFSV